MILYYRAKHTWTLLPLLYSGSLQTEIWDGQKSDLRKRGQCRGLPREFSSGTVSLSNAKQISTILESVNSQLYKELELSVRDHHSSNSSLHIVAELRRTRKIRDNISPYRWYVFTFHWSSYGASLSRSEHNFAEKRLINDTNQWTRWSFS